MTEIRDRLAAEFGAEAEIVNKAKREAGRACRAEMDRIREIESAASLPYLEGTKLVEWGYPRWSSGCPMSKTGEVAILEIFKKDDEVPVNCRRNMPDVGAIVLRILKKDGSKGLKVKCWNDRMKGYWFPEGVDPNAKKA